MRRRSAPFGGSLKITILGAGEAASLLARRLARAGHAVRVAAHDPTAAERLAAANVGVTAVPIGEAVDDSSVVIIAPGYADSAHVLHGLGSLENKLLVDMTVEADGEHRSSDATFDATANSFFGIDVINLFSRLFALDDLQQAMQPAIPLFYAGDIEHGRHVMTALIQSIQSNEVASASR